MMLILPCGAILESSNEPGSKGVYTNVGYTVLSAVIEATSGQTYQQYMIDHISKPLGMDQTHWTYDDALMDKEAAGYSPSVDYQAMMLPLLLDKDQMESVIREKVDGVLRTHWVSWV